MILCLLDVAVLIISSGWGNLDKPFWWGCPGACFWAPCPIGRRKGLFSCLRAPPKLWGWYVSNYRNYSLFLNLFILLFIDFIFLIILSYTSGWGNLDKPFWFGCPGACPTPHKLPPAHRKEEGGIFLPQGTPQTMRVICLELEILSYLYF